MKTAIVTAIYGGYDRPKSLRPDHGADDAYLYTDSHDQAREAAAAGWHAVLSEYPSGDKQLPPMLQAKWVKTHPHLVAPTADISIWLDGSMQVCVDGFTEKCVAVLGTDDISMTSHPSRSCIYPEASVTAELTRYADCDPQAQVDSYRGQGHPENWGLFASGASVRRHTDLVAEWGYLWWLECVNWTYQDQLSLPVVTRLLGEKGLTWNTGMPWGQWWNIYEHGV